MGIIGIDFGTTTSEVAIYKNEKATIIKNIKEGESNIVPSVVLIEGNNVKVGLKAKNQIVVKPNNTVIEIKKLIGTDKETIIDNKSYLPEEIAAMIIKKLKEIAEFYLGEIIEEAVITVPANFNDFQRKATKEAGRLAGLRIDRIINEPTAAAIAYGVDKLDKNMNILVYDFGGGTIDVTVLELYDGILNVKASRGNNNLGGKDIDKLLMDYVVNEFNNTNSIKLDLDNPRVISSLKFACEECKKSLSFEEEWDIIIPYIAIEKNNPIDLNITISRKVLDKLVEDIIRSTENIIDDAILSSNLVNNSIDKVVLVGGTTRMPAIRNMIERRFGINKIASGVNPEEAVAIGAAIQGAIKSGEISKSIIVTDAASYSLGVEVLGGYFDCIIKRDSKLPTKVSKYYKTVEDGQTDVEVKIYQGESENISQNTFIDSFELNGIPPSKRGEEQIIITFKYDLNGILSVEAKSASTGKHKELVLKTGAKINGYVHSENFEINDEVSKVELNNVDNNKCVTKEEINNLKEERLVGTSKTIIEEVKDEKEEDYTHIFGEIVNLVNYVNQILPSYDSDIQNSARDILREMVTSVREDKFKEARQLERDLAKLLNVEYDI